MKIKHKKKASPNLSKCYTLSDLFVALLQFLKNAVSITLKLKYYGDSEKVKKNIVFQMQIAPQMIIFK